MFIRKI